MTKIRLVLSRYGGISPVIFILCAFWVATPLWDCWPIAFVGIVGYFQGFLDGAETDTTGPHGKINYIGAVSAIGVLLGLIIRHIARPTP